jgi:WhiB family redox-sensing transcriptional regulator
MVTSEQLYERLMNGAKFLKRENGVGPACRDRGDIFFLENLFEPASRKAAEEFAKELCKECPLLRACGEYALAANETEGIWAGMNPSERRILAQKNQRSARSGSLSS